MIHVVTYVFYLLGVLDSYKGLCFVYRASIKEELVHGTLTLRI